MCDKKFTVAIIGVGGRGGYVYGTLMAAKPERFEVTALCDINEEKLAYFSERLGVARESLFTDERVFFEKRRADVLVMCTQDRDHVRHATLAFELGYDVLLEKPITADKDAMESLLALRERTGSRALVCHVLRYAPTYMKLAELIESGMIGRLIAINAIEQVGYFHHAQSFVRGHWSKAETSTPMILAKCSHDLDLLQFYANSSCETVSSIGELAYFKAENAPDGAADRCMHCVHMDTCRYSAKTYYLDGWLSDRTDDYPYNVPCTSPITEEKMRAALENGPQGRCVFKCDNNVVDHQITQMTFKNGVKATLTMMAFTSFGGRKMEFFGTHGQLTLDEVHGVIRVGVFGSAEYEINIRDLATEGSFHGGGDAGLVDTFYDVLVGRASEKTSLRHSAESHLMGIAAEKSRLAGGAVVSVH